MSELDVDWAVVGSGFGGSVAALRLAEKGYRVRVVEQGRRYRDQDLPTSSWQARRFLWQPRLGLHGIMRTASFRHLFSSAQTGVGGGSLVYGGVLFRPLPGFYADPQWSALGPWQDRLAPHYATAERMLGVRTVPHRSASMNLTQDVATHFGDRAVFSLAPVGVFFGEPGTTVPDPYFGGEGPDRTGCTRCGDCMTGCRTGAANTLTKNYLWLAEQGGAEIVAERKVVDVRPLGAADGSDGYRIITQTPGSRGRRRDLESFTAQGVVFAGGAVGTNELLAGCKHRGSLPRLSERLGTLVRTNSESVLTVLLPGDRGTWQDVAASSRVIIDGDTQIEFLTYGRRGDLMALFFTLMVGDGSRGGRVLAWLRAVLSAPVRAVRTSWPRGWSRRTMMVLVMQAHDNALSFHPRRRLLGGGVGLTTRAHGERPAPTYSQIGQDVASWLAEHTGGVPQSSVFEVLGNRPMTAHVLGGAPLSDSAERGVVDERLRVFGYRNMLVCDAAALPANPGVNPALSITALAEHAMSLIPARDAQPDEAATATV